MNVVLAKTGTGRALTDVFASARDRLPGTEKIMEARRQAFEVYERLGLPHRRIEEWKYTDLRTLMREVLPLAREPDAAALERARAAVASAAIEGAAKLVLVDGVFVSELSEPTRLAGVAVRTLREILQTEISTSADLLADPVNDAMISLNAAMAMDGVVLDVADGAVLSGPIQIIHVVTGSSVSAFTRLHLNFGKGSHTALVQSFIGAEGADNYQINDVTSVALGDDARLSHLRVMADAGGAFNISSGLITAGARTRLNLFNLTSGGAVSRYQGFLTLAGEGSELSVNGVNLLRLKQHADTTLVVDHAVPHCTSRENFRAVVEDQGHSVFQGRIIVRPDAQKTDGKMMTRALLLSDQAEADNKPELEIFADDVTCGHGATSGALDEDLLFYLRARGLSEKDAQALLIQAFLGEAIEEITEDSLRELTIAEAERWLEARRR